MEKGRIFSTMISEVELSENDNQFVRALVVLDRIHLRHMQKEKVLATFEVTWEEVLPYEEEWARLRNQSLVYA